MADEGLSLGLGLELSLGVGRSGRREGVSNAKRNCLSELFGSRIGSQCGGKEPLFMCSGLNLSNGEEPRMPSPSRRNDNDEGECSRGSDDDVAAHSDPSRKKLRLSKYQSLLLEDTFKEHSTLNPIQKLGLAKQLNLRPRQVEVWFQNRRARTKLKQTEVDCDYLKRCCERLSEENRRLQKEAQELRALKLSSQVYMHMNPPTTLTMCPSCEKITSGPSASTPKATDCLPRPINVLSPWPALHVPL